MTDSHNNIFLFWAFLGDLDCSNIENINVSISVFLLVPCNYNVKLFIENRNDNHSDIHVTMYVSMYLVAFLMVLCCYH